MLQRTSAGCASYEAAGCASHWKCGGCKKTVVLSKEGLWGVGAALWLRSKCVPTPWGNSAGVARTSRHRVQAQAPPVPTLCVECHFSSFLPFPVYSRLSSPRHLLPLLLLLTTDKHSRFPRAMRRPPHAAGEGKELANEVC
ncbi:hypothetical protein TraAM80_07981 [Trypanosoma rangeli]|uniref:Uncharacterized protein n=1 Tax=Trypanosoma rangeli TaxID=5698 RepID=A0A3R7N475_TRYRA|nr:uncharacterized protein TraAM80_07981 [Trypanosoma rangeli]RNE99855.1 hypothetical protein TraAM80_07981 [Trypanosoma rangeli]|eukprot:RNE99855.1 hypothetical protein TraAM80_07981 [Trypanosoma rangeli]